MNPAAAFRIDVPFSRDLGIEFVSAEAGRAVIALDLAARHLNSWSVAHGGVLMTMLDVVMAVAGRSLDADAGGAITLEMKVNFLEPAHAGSRITASGLAYHRSKSLVYCEGQVNQGEGRLIAKAMGSFKYRSLRGDD